MKTIKRKNNRINLVVLNEKGEVSNVGKFPDSSNIHQEHLHQSRLIFNLALTLITMSATVCFTGITLFWSGKISEEAVIRTVDLVSRVVTSYCIPLIESSQRHLNESAEQEENDK